MSFGYHYSWIIGLLFQLLIPPTITGTIHADAQDKLITCNSHENCFINCDGENSCAYSQIQCPIRYDCEIFCGDNSNTCLNVVINATYASLFQLNGCAGNDILSCSGITVYFPPKDSNGNKHSFINVGNNFNALSQSLQFYAINGWTDINTTLYTGTFEYFYGTMHCTNDYSQTCNFDEKSEWTCDSPTHLCNDPYPNGNGPTDSVSAKKSSKERTDILWYIVVTLSMCICGFSVLLIYNIRKSVRAKQQKQKQTDSKRQTELTLKPIPSKSQKDTSIVKEGMRDTKSAPIPIPIPLKQDTKPRRHKSLSSFNISHIPRNPVQIVTDMDSNSNININIASIPSMTSLPSLPSYKESETADTLLNAIINNTINYSIKQERLNTEKELQNTISDILNDKMAQSVSADDVSVSQTESITSEESSGLGNQIIEIDIDDSDSETDSSANHIHIPSVMFLYNAEMAIPEETEHSKDKANANETAPSTSTTKSPMTPKLNVTLNETFIVSPTPTLSDNEDKDGLLQTVMPWPNTPKLHPSSNCNVSVSTDTAVSNMTYMTASSLVNSLMSTDGENESHNYNSESSYSETKSASAHSNHSLQIDSYDDNIILDDVSNETPICKSDSRYSHTNDTEREALKGKDDSDTLMISEDRDDTSSWVSGNEEDMFDDSDQLIHTIHSSLQGIQYDQLNHLQVSADNGAMSSNTEYDSSTSSIGTDMQQYFREEITEDEEEPFDFGQ